VTVPATTPLVDVPLPHLRPALESTTLGYQGATATMTAPTTGPADRATAMPPIHGTPAASSPSTTAAAPAMSEPAPPSAAPAPADTAADADEERHDSDQDVPLPHLRPAGAGVRLASLPSASDLKLPPPAATSTCGIAIAGLGVEAEALAPIEEGECGIAEPVAVASLDGGAVDFSAKAIVGCDLAEKLSNWVHGTVEPLAAKNGGGRLTGLRIAASYACRNRDSLPDAKLSEHAKGKAIDISAFRIDGRWITVKDGWQTEGADKDFLVAVRESACGPFKTVLGPGSDVYHTDHFHLDLAERRHDGTYCK
jgi:hypothetical protein